MIDAEKIKDLLWNEYQAGATFQGLSRKYQLSYAYLHDLLYGKRSVDGLSIKKINAMFPDCRLELFGDGVAINAPANSGNVVGINNGSVAGSMEPAIDRILDCVELSAEEKVKVLKVLKK